MTTADPKSARDHARAQAGTRVDAMPILPALADDVPVGARVVWEETLAPGGYGAKRLSRGTRLRLIDSQGDACLSMLVFNAEMSTERLNIADTLKVQWNGYITAGKLILSDMGRVMLSVLTDTAATHDAFCGASNQASNARKYGDGFNHGQHPNARDRFMLGVAKFGLSRKDVHPCLNWFKGVRIEDDGTTVPQVGPFPAGREVILRAEMDLIVVFANTPHVLDPRQTYSVTPVRLTAWTGEVTSEDDTIRIATPEGLRAFLNTEDYYAR
ncbi:urea amidolyase associated protein UAAP1 [Asticcacaulis excentricus]|uniref:Urea carboxylase-associated protein 2 n=1 Tax=Asticcacaulis excentricus (strain ATCC 15261 / DSM 4724 / KCTC 12464 / NCIMB 9791 / VKM B-1370 / CB 48) TaxID=573065 RepID=E8RVC7_ASTEC|nr:urea amidolyase associated protein UAAP1 [Asticcacaulis excentricus]ADU15268.1 urea carboxylase-associated protein 2 [Asticcacaulis excentricus CB 48]